MSSASSAVTYTSVYTDSEPRRVFWEADEELSDRGSPRVIVYGYDGLPRLPVAPSSPDYDEQVLSTEEQPLPPVVSPTVELPEYVAESDPEEDPEEYEDDETEDGPVDYPMDGGDDGDDDDGDSSREDANNEDEDEEDKEEEEEEHLATADSVVVIPTDELVSPRREQSMACHHPPLTLLPLELGLPFDFRLPYPFHQRERLARCTALAALPLSPLPPPLHMSPPVDCKDDIPETEMPPYKRLCLSTLGSRDTWVDPIETVLEIAPMTVGEAQMVETLRVMGDMRREMGDMQTELLALQEQPRRARQPRGEARVPNHQDAPKDADSHI
nr:hypothetical protein [Tanacetum cinerariifolium]